MQEEAGQVCFMGECRERTPKMMMVEAAIMVLAITISRLSS